MREGSLSGPVGDVFVYKGVEGRSSGYFGSVSVCKSSTCRKLKETNETVAHERPQTIAQSMENIYMCTLYRFTPLLIYTKRHPITVDSFSAKVLNSRGKMRTFWTIL